MTIRLFLLAGILVWFGLAGCGVGEEDLAGFEPEVPAHYAFRLPGDYDPEYEYPVLVCLHGHNRTEQQALDLWDRGFFPDPDFVLLAVRAPFEGAGGFAWFKQRREEDQDLDNVALRRISAATAEERVMEVLEEFEDEYAIDPDWRFVVGFSQGANIAFHTGLRHPEIFQGVGGIAGRMDTFILSPRRVRDIDEMDVFVALGRDEGPRAIAAVEGDRDFLQQRGASVRLYLFDGGHVVTRQACIEMENFFDLVVGTETEDPEQEWDDGYDEEYEEGG